LERFEVPEEDDMGRDVNFKLSGQGVQFSYSAGAVALEIVLNPRLELVHDD
jgi:hypothetical protein